MSAVIGKGGESIRAIQGASGADVDINKDSANKTCTIKGTDQQIATAQAMIRDLIAGRELTIANTITEEVSVPQKQHMIIIGKGGASIQAIQGESGARVTVPSRDTVSDIISVRGTRDEVYGARFSTGIYTRGCHWFPRMLA